MKEDGISAISSDERQVSELTVSPDGRLSMANSPVPKTEVDGSSAVSFEARQVSGPIVSLEERLSMGHDLVPTPKHAVSAPIVLR